MKMKAHKTRRRIASASLVIIWVSLVALMVKLFDVAILATIIATAICIVFHYYYDKWGWFSISYYA